MKALLIRLTAIVALAVFPLESSGAGRISPLPFQDPFIYEENGIFYMYGSDDGGIGVLVSDDLEHWYVPDGKEHWTVFPGADSLGNGEPLNPSVESSGNEYTLYVSSDGDKGIKAVSHSPLGPFTDAVATDRKQPARRASFRVTRCGKLKISGRPAIDAHVCRDDAEGFYANPVRKASSADPTVLEGPDGYFYLTHTETHGRLSLKRSKDLVKWEDRSDIFYPGKRPSFVTKGSIWAPDLNRIGNRFVVYYSMSTWGGIHEAGIGRGIADTLEGNWKDLGKLFISKEIGVTNSIDPFFISDGGGNYLFWGSFHGIYCIGLNADGTGIADGAHPIRIAGNAYEGTYILKKGAYYYLFASTGSCCEGMRSTYTTVVGRSTALTGPYVDRSGRPMLENHHETVLSGNGEFAGPGHNAEIVTDNDGSTWMLYHSYWGQMPFDGRMLMLDRILWDEQEWPYIKSGGKPSFVSRKPRFN